MQFAQSRMSRSRSTAQLCDICNSNVQLPIAATPVVASRTSSSVAQDSAAAIARPAAPGPALAASTVNDPPAPPAPFTFQPSASGPRTASITAWASALTSDACSRAWIVGVARQHGAVGLQVAGDERRGAVVRALRATPRGAHRRRRHAAAPRRPVRCTADESCPWARSDDEQLRVERADRLRRQRQRRPPRRRVARHLDQRGTSRGRGPLILDAALLRETACLDEVGAASQRGRIDRRATQAIERGKHGHAHARRRPHRRARRHRRSDVEQPGAVRNFRLIQAGTDQGIRAHLRRRARRPMPFRVEVAQSHLDAGRAVVWGDAHVDSGPYRQVTHRAMPGKPRVGPAAEVGDPGRRGDGDVGHCKLHNCTISSLPPTFDGRRCLKFCNSEILKFSTPPPASPGACAGRAHRAASRGRYRTGGPRAGLLHRP